MSGEERHAEEQARRQHPPDARPRIAHLPALAGDIEGQQDQRQPNLRLKDRELQRGVAGQIAAEGEDHGGRQPADAAASQAPCKQVGEHGRQHEVRDRLQLQRVIGEPPDGGQRHG